MIKDRIILLLTVLATLTSCSLLHNDKVVAKVGNHVLYASDVVKFIPAGTPAADSLELAKQYINSWAAEIIMQEMAQKKLPESEKDITKEIEEYKRALLKYRYEQHYIAEHLDTVVTWDEISEFYNANEQLYKLERPIIKAHYVKFPAISPMKDEIIALAASQNDDDIAKLDSLSQTVVIRFQTYGNDWIDIATLAKDYGIDYGTLIAEKKDSVIGIVDEQGQLNYAYLFEYIGSGKTSPLSYCSSQVRKAIINKRKYILFNNLEKDLLTDAINKGKLELYD